MTALSIKISTNRSGDQDTSFPDLSPRSELITRTSSVVASTRDQCWPVLSTRDWCWPTCLTRGLVSATAQDVKLPKKVCVANEKENRLSDIERRIVIARYTRREKGNLDVASRSLREVKEELASLLKIEKHAANRCLDVRGREGGLNREEFLDTNANFKKIASKRFACKKSYEKANREHAAASEKYEAAVAQAEAFIPKGKDFFAWQNCTDLFAQA